MELLFIFHFIGNLEFRGAFMYIPFYWQLGVSWSFYVYSILLATWSFVELYIILYCIIFAYDGDDNGDGDK